MDQYYRIAERCFGNILAVIHQYSKIVFAEFAHHLPAYSAGSSGRRDDSVLSADYSNADKIPSSLGHSLEKSGSFGAVCGSECGVFDIASGVNGSV